MPRERIMIEGFRCNRCSHTWVATKKRLMPRICPKCKSPGWDSPVGIVVVKPYREEPLPDI